MHAGQVHTELGRAHLRSGAVFLTAALTLSQCPAGRSQLQKRSADCVPCQPGYFTGVAGLATCNPCDPGTALNDTDGTICHECAIGDFQARQGQKGCDPCVAGLYSPTPRA